MYIAPIKSNVLQCFSLWETFSSRRPIFNVLCFAVYLHPSKSSPQIFTTAVTLVFQINETLAKSALWELNSFLIIMQELSFAPINFDSCRPRKWKRSTCVYAYTETKNRRPVLIPNNERPWRYQQKRFDHFVTCMTPSLCNAVCQI